MTSWSAGREGEMGAVRLVGGRGRGREVRKGKERQCWTGLTGFVQQGAGAGEARRQRDAAGGARRDWAGAGVLRC